MIKRRPPGAQLEAIQAEAIKIIRITGRLRTAEAVVRKERGETGFRVMSAAEMFAEELLSRGEPKPTDPASEAFEEAIRFWALRVAWVVTYEQWNEIVWKAKAEVPEFPGDVIRFFETRFEGLELKCGAMIAP